MLIVLGKQGPAPERLEQGFLAAGQMVGSHPERISSQGVVNGRPISQRHPAFQEQDARFAIGRRALVRRQFLADIIGKAVGWQAQHGCHQRSQQIHMIGPYGQVGIDVLGRDCQRQWLAEAVGDFSPPGLIHPGGESAILGLLLQFLMPQDLEMNQPPLQNDKPGQQDAGPNGGAGGDNGFHGGSWQGGAECLTIRQINSVQVFDQCERAGIW